MRVVRVFIASPNDLVVERLAFRDAIDELNRGFGDGLEIRFQVLGWEDTLASTGRLPQTVINKDIDQCDVFVLAMNRRWGRKDPDSEASRSFTEEEYHRALHRWETTGSPEIFVFFKHVDAQSMGDPGPQLKKVLKFRKALEKSQQVLYRQFVDDRSFKSEIDRHLRAFAIGNLPKPNAPREAVSVPQSLIEELAKERLEKKKLVDELELAKRHSDASLARAEEIALDFAESAGRAALEGRVEEARQNFAKVIQRTANVDVLSLAFQYFFRIGEFQTAEELSQTALAVAESSDNAAGVATALLYKGWIYETHGDLDRAERMHLKALAIEEKLGRREGVARNYGSLGLIYLTRGDLDRAEQMQLMSLGINEELGQQEGMADGYGSLGLIYRTRGDLDRAEQMHLKSLEIDEELGLKEWRSCTATSA